MAESMNNTTSVKREQILANNERNLQEFYSVRDNHHNILQGEMNNVSALSVFLIKLWKHINLLAMHWIKRTFSWQFSCFHPSRKDCLL
jgi:hypothetical protein